VKPARDHRPVCPASITKRQVKAYEELIAEETDAAERGIACAGGGSVGVPMRLSGPALR
jgi:hypothetical protein